MLINTLPLYNQIDNVCFSNSLGYQVMVRSGIGYMAQTT